MESTTPPKLGLLFWKKAEEREREREELHLFVFAWIRGYGQYTIQNIQKKIAKFPQAIILKKTQQFRVT